MISFIKRLAARAGQLCLSEQKKLNPADLGYKSPKDLVTTADRRVEEFIITGIKQKYPDHALFGEETGESSGKSPWRWIIDPIDGTTSFVHHQPFFGVSIAVEKDHELLMGAVYAPVLDQLFFAAAGQGAFLNDAPITVSDTTRLDKAVMATGFACLREGLSPNNLDHFNRIVPRLRDIRRYGSAALDLCYTACGRLDGFWEMNLNLYDIAAGALIVKEAGGIVTDFSGKPDFPAMGTAAAGPGLHSRLIQLLNQTKSPT